VHILSENTLSFCRSLTVDGELSAEDLWELGNWLNLNPECCDHWPGDELAEVISKAFSNGSVSSTELKQIASKFSAIERKAGKLREVISLETAAETFDPLVCQLPSIEKKTVIKSFSDPDTTYTVDLSVHSCSCQDWISNRRKAPEGSLSRCCKHVALALHKTSPDGGWPDWLGAIIDDCRLGKRGTNPSDTWSVVRIRDQFVLFSKGKGDWSNVYSMHQGTYSRFGFNRAEKRWSYGMRPYFSATIQTAIEELVNARRGWFF
jgi:hypothetical protein